MSLWVYSDKLPHKILYDVRGESRENLTEEWHNEIKLLGRASLASDFVLNYSVARAGIRFCSYYDNPLGLIVMGHVPRRTLAWQYKMRIIVDKKWTFV